MAETSYPEVAEIVEINKKVGSNGTMVNEANLEFTLQKMINAKTLARKATVLLQGIIKGHPFVDGNKRTAFGLMEVFLESNGYKVTLDTTEGFEFLVGVGAGRVSEGEVEDWIARHLTELREKGEEDGPETENS